MFESKDWRVGRKAEGGGFNLVAMRLSIRLNSEQIVSSPESDWEWRGLGSPMSPGQLGGSSVAVLSQPGACSGTCEFPSPVSSWRLS